MRDGVKRPPASVEKLYTTIAAVGKLGAAARLHTVVVGTGHLGPGGVWHGNLYLRGGGDPTFGDGTFNKVWELGYGPTASQLATQLAHRGIHRVTGSVIGDESMFDAARGGPATNFAPDLPDFGGQLSGLTYDHGANVARGLARGVRRQAAGGDDARPGHPRRRPRRSRGRRRGARSRLAIVSSPPLSVLIDLMNVPSDDLFAEMLTKQLGRRFAHEGSIAAGAKVISHEIATYDLHPRIVDGSGLSRDDRSSPARDRGPPPQGLAHRSVGRILSGSLPILGVNGTTRRIGTGTVAQGRCIAKTGTLNYVTNLAGYCHSRGGHMLTFALFLDGPSNEQSIALLTRMTAAIVSY